MADNRRYTFAYYCSGHGFGHATRVVALTHELLRRSHRVYICTNAPEHVFQSAIQAGAAYRHAEIDAGIVQPKAYDVARRKTIDGLKRFLDDRERKLYEETWWLKQIKANAVLVDAPFLPCAAAARVGIPSVIISNFTFDSCYSYLSVSTLKDNAATSLARAMQGACLDEATGTLQVPNGSSPTSSISPTSSTSDNDEDEPPLPAVLIAPLVRQVTEDYANASLLLRLPGCIPIPAFDTDVPMPAEKWTNLEAHSFKEDIMDLLARDTASIPACTCSTSPELSSNKSVQQRRQRRRRVIETPLIARPVAQDVYTTQKRRDILSSLGIPIEQQDGETTKILVVSFGGQSIPKPSASRPNTPLPSSRNGSISIENGMSLNLNGNVTIDHNAVNGKLEKLRSNTNGNHTSPFQHGNLDQDVPSSGGYATPLGKSASQEAAPTTSSSSSTQRTLPTQEQMASSQLSRVRSAAPRLQRLMTQDHLYLPGAPPALHKPGQMNGTANAGGGPRHRRKISLEIPKMYRSEGDRSSNSTVEQIELSFVENSLDSIASNHTAEGEENGISMASEGGHQGYGAEEEEEDQLIPKGWIAIVCGLSVKDGADELPENFYAAPRDVYVPDLTAICDVLLGKLGYGTCSETVSSQTPFVYVPRPLFVEEFGLKRLMEASGTALPMTRADFEAGNWARLIERAYELGKEKRKKHVDAFEKRVSSLDGESGGVHEDSAACTIAKEVEKFMREELMGV